MVKSMKTRRKTVSFALLLIETTFSMKLSRHQNLLVYISVHPLILAVMFLPIYIKQSKQFTYQKEVLPSRQNPLSVNTMPANVSLSIQMLFTLPNVQHQTKQFCFKFRLPFFPSIFQMLINWCLTQTIPTTVISSARNWTFSKIHYRKCKL